MSSETIDRSETSETHDHNLDSKHRPPKSRNLIGHMLREQAPFLIIGVAISTLFFHFLPSSQSHHDSFLETELAVPTRRVLLEEPTTNRYNEEKERRGRVPLGVGLKTRKPKRILVTGGAGFVGSHLVDRLIERGDSVIVVDNFFTGRKENVLHHMGNPNFELIRHDVVLPILLEVDQIYHLACPASPVHYNTSEVYGDPLQHPQAETYWGNVNPIGNNNNVRIARIFNTYGPRMCLDDGRVVSNFVAQALRKEPLTVYGDGKQTRSFQYVSDLVEGLMRLMEGDHVGPFNLGNPGEFTMLELAQVVQETIDPNAKIEFRPNTEDDPHMRKPDISKAKELLGWQPSVSLREGLPKMVIDFKQRLFGDPKGSGVKGVSTA
ncbi:hypothetical protein SESBI_33497 [Sesbania bispinosa]|nr:hypothetical protein SESBI_33497 [Sesbania bispinosa]